MAALQLAILPLVGLVGLWIDEVVVEDGAIGGDIAFLAGWIAIPKGVGWNVVGDHTARPDQGMVANGDPCNDGRIGPNGSPFFDDGWCPFCQGAFGAGVDVVGKGDIGTDENPIF